MQGSKKFNRNYFVVFDVSKSSLNIKQKHNIFILSTISFLFINPSNALTNNFRRFNHLQ